MHLYFNRELCVQELSLMQTEIVISHKCSFVSMAMYYREKKYFWILRNLLSEILHRTAFFLLNFLLSSEGRNEVGGGGDAFLAVTWN